MTTPPLPANLASGAVYPESFADDVRDLLEYFRDNRPILKVGIATESIGSGGGGTKPDFASETPTYNIGTFVAGGANNGWDVPDAGIYVVHLTARWATGSAGYRDIRITSEGTALSDGWVRQINAGSSIVGQTTTAVVDCIAGQEIGALVTHTQGSALDVTMWMSILWQSSGP